MLEVTKAELHGPWTTLAELREGAIFETRDGIRAVKSEYHYGNEPGSQCQCVLLESGEYAHFPERNNTEIREIIFSAESVRDAELRGVRAGLEAAAKVANPSSLPLCPALFKDCGPLLDSVATAIRAIDPASLVSKAD